MNFGMPDMNFIVQHRVSIAIVIVIGAALLYLYRDISVASRWNFFHVSRSIGEQTRCSVEKFDDALRNARRNTDDTVSLLVHWNEKPSLDVRDFLSEKNIVIYPETWVNDYVLGVAKVSELCALAAFPGVTRLTFATAAE
ncbi:MAG: hypothetical protein AAB490_06320 [Patescibacteria group bacterium]